MTATIQNAYESQTGPEEPALAKRLRGRRKLAEPLHEDPRTELKRLVREHRMVMKNVVRFKLSISDRKNRATGETIKCPLPETVKSDVKATINRLKKYADSYKPLMRRELERFPVYVDFLSKVYGIGGEVTCAYLVSSIDIRKAEKVSNLIRYCGNGCNANGRAERRAKGASPNATGGPGTFNDEIKSKLYVAITGLWKSAAKFTVCDTHRPLRPGKKATLEQKKAFRMETLACTSCTATKSPYGVTSKYLTRWRDAKRGEVCVGREKGAHDKGRRKATDLFIEDLYIVWRASEGLPVWCSWYASKRMYEHGGKPLSEPNVPKLMTLQEALSAVGYVGPTSLAEPYVDKAPPPAEDEEDEEDEDEAAE